MVDELRTGMWMDMATRPETAPDVFYQYKHHHHQIPDSHLDAIMARAAQTIAESAPKSIFRTLVPCEHPAVAPFIQDAMRNLLRTESGRDVLRVNAPRLRKIPNGTHMVFTAAALTTLIDAASKQPDTWDTPHITHAASYLIKNDPWQFMSTPELRDAPSLRPYLKQAEQHYLETSPLKPAPTFAPVPVTPSAQDEAYRNGQPVLAGDRMPGYAQLIHRVSQATRLGRQVAPADSNNLHRAFAIASVRNPSLVFLNHGLLNNAAEEDRLLAEATKHAAEKDPISLLRHSGKIVHLPEAKAALCIAAAKEPTAAFVYSDQFRRARCASDVLVAATHANPQAAVNHLARYIREPYRQNIINAAIAQDTSLIEHFTTEHLADVRRTLPVIESGRSRA